MPKNSTADILGTRITILAVDGTFSRRMDVCRDELKICSQTANRYISFYELVGVYPRIVICDLTFDTIMYCKMAIIDELEKDEDLGVHFRTPLHEVSIQASMNIEGKICRL